MPDYSDLISLVRGPLPERPLLCFYDFAPCHAGVVGGIPNMMRYYFDVEEKMSVQMKVKELFPEALIFPGVFPDFGVIVETSAFGGQIRWLDDSAPYIAPSLRHLRDVDSLKLPEPGTTGLTAPVLVQQKIMREKLKARGKELERWALTMGPAEIAGLLLGYESYYFGFYDDPRRIKTLMELVTDFAIRWVRTQEKGIGGAQVIMVADHVCSQVKPEQLEEFILPYEQAIFSSFPEAVKVYHNEGFHSDAHIEAILRFGADLWHFGSDAHSLPDLYSKIGDRIVPFGGLNPHGVIRTGTPEEVRIETREVMEAARGRRLLLSTGTGTTPDVTLANVRAMVEEALT
jgi:uroporphyrinogen decarboxylase